MKKKIIAIIIIIKQIELIAIRNYLKKIISKTTKIYSKINNRMTIMTIKYNNNKY